MQNNSQLTETPPLKFSKTTAIKTRYVYPETPVPFVYQQSTCIRMPFSPTMNSIPSAVSLQSSVSNFEVVITPVSEQYNVLSDDEKVEEDVLSKMLERVPENSEYCDVTDYEIADENGYHLLKQYSSLMSKIGSNEINVDDGKNDVNDNSFSVNLVPSIVTVKNLNRGRSFSVFIGGKRGNVNVDHGFIADYKKRREELDSKLESCQTLTMTGFEHFYIFCFFVFSFFKFLNCVS